jgi:uncharacterized alpha-E superfamily protein
MLARHAEDLFWIGRYLERAEDTSRMLDVTYHGLLESSVEDPTIVWRELVKVLHLEQDFEARGIECSEGPVSEFLVLDHENGGSIVSSIACARDNARTVRERISTELWEAINTLHLELGARDLRADLQRQPYELYRIVKARCQMITGVAAETMPRDDGWRFLVLGRMLERAEMTCRLLSVRWVQRGSPDPQATYQHWGAVLKWYRRSRPTCACTTTSWASPRCWSSCCSRASSRAACCSVCARPRISSRGSAPATVRFRRIGSSAACARRSNTSTFPSW